MVLSLITSILLSSQAFAAPNPAMGSSSLSQKFLGNWTTKEGITFYAAPTDWKIDAPEAMMDELKTPFRIINQKFPTASLSFSTDRLKRDQNISAYIKHWVKEYQYFGFEILKTTPTQILGEKGYVIDLYHQKNQKQVRQFLALSNQNTLVVTCTDQLSTFRTSVNQCHQVYRSLKWVPLKNKTLEP